MPRAVDGTYETPTSSVAPAVASTTIDPDDFNSLVTDIETAISEAVYTTSLGTTDNRLTRTDGTNEKKLQASAIAVDDSGNMSGMGYMDFAEAASPAAPAANSARLYCYDSSGTTKLAYKDSAGTTVTIESAAGVSPGTSQGRLTLTSGTAVTVSDVTAATSIYFTPSEGNRIALYDGTSDWNLRSFTEITIALGTLVDATNYDVFVYDNAGTVTADTLVAWTNATTRATAITLQDGVWVKSGATTRRYIGTFRTTSTTTTEDSLAKRFVWNVANRRPRAMRVTETTNSWPYSTASWQQANASTANQIAFVRGLNEDSVRAAATALVVSSSAAVKYPLVGIGLDAASAVATGATAATASVNNSFSQPAVSLYEGFPGLGYHYLTWIEKGAGSDTQTWYGDNGGTDTANGIYGEVWA